MVNIAFLKLKSFIIVFIGTFGYAGSLLCLYHDDYLCSQARADDGGPGDPVLRRGVRGGPQLQGLRGSRLRLRTWTARHLPGV